MQAQAPAERKPHEKEGDYKQGEGDIVSGVRPLETSLEGPIAHTIDATDLPESSHSCQKARTWSVAPSSFHGCWSRTGHAVELLERSEVATG